MTETEYYREILEEIRDFKPSVTFAGEFLVLLDMQSLQASARVALKHGPLLAACNRAVCNRDGVIPDLPPLEKETNRGT